MAVRGTSVSVVSSGKAADADQGVTVISIRGKFGYKNLKKFSPRRHEEIKLRVLRVFVVNKRLLIVHLTAFRAYPIYLPIRTSKCD
jgi:hypothetical protein